MSNIYKYLGIGAFIFIVCYFFYTIYKVLTRKTIKYIKSTCPDYWTYDSSGNGKCTSPDGSKVIQNISQLTECDKYRMTYGSAEVEGVGAWNGINNNSNVQEKCG